MRVFTNFIQMEKAAFILIAQLCMYLFKQKENLPQALRF